MRVGTQQRVGFGPVWRGGGGLCTNGGFGCAGGCQWPVPVVPQMVAWALLDKRWQQGLPLCIGIGRAMSQAAGSIKHRIRKAGT